MEQTALQPLVREIVRDWLRREMSDISEEHYCSGWMLNLERSLWNAVEGLPADYDYGMGPIGVERLQRLRDVRDLLGEWTDGDNWYTLAEWRARTSQTRGE